MSGEVHLTKVELFVDQHVQSLQVVADPTFTQLPHKFYVTVGFREQVPVMLMTINVKFNFLKQILNKHCYNILH